MRYSEEQLDSLAEQIDLAEYIGHTEQLHKKGENYFINCPLHKGDDTPSLCIYPNNSWYCYGCHKGGNIFNWIVQFEQTSFPKAVEKVAKLTGIELVHCVKSPSMEFYKEYNKVSETQDMQTIVRPELDWQHDYIEMFSDELPAEWLEEGLTEEAMREYYIRTDKSGNRIVYPVFDSEGRFIGVKGRTRFKGYKTLKLQKYMNYYKIGTIDFYQGWQQALPEIISTKSIIIFEGVKSCIKAWAWDIRNSVASETAALSDGQIELLAKTGLNEVNIAWDSDQDFNKIKNDSKIKILKMITKVFIIRAPIKILGEKASPADKGEKVFRKLFAERVRI